MVIDFDAEAHTYRVDGEIKPHITQILGELKLVQGYEFVDPFYRDRGLAVHECVRLWVKDLLDPFSVDPECEPFFEGFKKWWFESGVQPEHVRASEAPLYSARLDYCGTPDLVIHEIIEIKCSKKPDRAAELQGVLQQNLWGDNFGELIPFKILQLPGDGTYKVIDYKTKDANLAEAIMSLYRWKVKK